MPKEQINGIEIDKILSILPYDHEGHYLAFKSIYEDEIKYIPEIGWMAYDNGYWDNRYADSCISKWITGTLRRRYQVAQNERHTVPTSKIEASRGNIEAIKSIAKDRMTLRLDKFNTEPHLLNCANGVLNLKTLELMPHDAKYCFNYKLDVKWDPEIKDYAWNQFCADCVGEPVDLLDGEMSALELLQLCAGYSITGDTSAETMFYIFGPPRSGKGTFMTAIQNLLGPLSNTVNIGTLCSSSKSSDQNFELAGLSTCRYVTVAETGRDTYLDAGRIKNLTGNDPIQCAFKFKNSFRYTPKFKVWISSNHEINLDASDEAVWDRLRAFHFSTDHKANPDTRIKQRMTTNLEPVLLWCAQGAQAWYKLQEQGKPMPRTTNMGKYLMERKDESDYVKQFLEVGKIDKGNDFIPSNELFSKFKDFCTKNHIEKHLSIRNFNNDLKRRGFDYSIKSYMGVTARGFSVKVDTVTTI